MFMKAKLAACGCFIYILLGAGAVYAHSDLSSVGCHAQGGLAHCHTELSLAQSDESDETGDSGESDDSEMPEVKKSKSGICHEKGAGHYARTKTFTAFATMEACIASGGRAPL